MLLLLKILFLIPFGSALAAAEPVIEARAEAETEIDSYGQTALEADSQLTLHEVIVHTFEREPGLLVVAARRFEADALKKNSARLLSGAPVISANHATDRLWAGDGYRQWDVQLGLPLWWPGQRKGRRQSARAADSAARYAVRAHELEVAGWVRQAVTDLAVAHVRRELAEAEWRAEDELATQIERAVALEELARRELLLARSASLDRRLIYLKALEESHHAEDRYFLLTGLSAWPMDWNEKPPDFDSLENHPFLLLAGEETARAQGELDRLKADQWGAPVLALGSQHERDVSGASFDGRIVAGLRIPLGRRRDAQAEVAGARRAVAERRRDHQRLERNLRERLTESEHRFALSFERVSAAAEQAEMAAEYLRLTELGFGLGETDLGQLLRARTRATAANQTHREALILRQSCAGKMNQALGVVP